MRARRRLCLSGRAGFDRGARDSGRRPPPGRQPGRQAACRGARPGRRRAGRGSCSAVADRVVVVDRRLLAEYHPENLSGGPDRDRARRSQPRAVLLGNDTYSQELAPRLAHRLGGSAAGDAVDIAADGRPAARDARRLRRQGDGRDRAGAIAGRGLGARPGHRAGRSRGRPRAKSKASASSLRPTIA